MAQKHYKVSAPGSLMLLGEHAVLHGRRAACCAVNKRIHITLEASDKRAVTIHSALGEYEASLDEPTPSGRFSFIIEAINRHRENLPGGFTLDIASEFSSTVGLGSSAAVTVATNALLLAYSQRPYTREDIFRESLQTIRQVQGLGSGADVAASVFGGVLIYRADPPKIKKLRYYPPIVLIYSGHKEPTVEVVKYLESQRVENPDKFERIYDSMDASIVDAIDAVEKQNWTALGNTMNQNQQYMAELGLSTPDLDAVICILNEQPDIYGAKISGSGLGDCAVGIGMADLDDIPYDVIDVSISPDGIRIE